MASKPLLLPLRQPLLPLLHLLRPLRLLRQ